MSHGKNEIPWGKIKLPLAEGLCMSCMEDKEFVASNGIYIIIYCTHSRAGGIMRLIDGTPTGQWIILTPITPEEFANHCNTLSIQAMINISKDKGGSSH